MPESRDWRYMSRALELARRGLFSTDPNPRVGCVLVKEDRIIGEGWHEFAGTEHAEIMALASAGDSAEGASCYVTLEPCFHQGRTPPCCDALIRSGISRLVVAMEDPNPLVRGKGIKAIHEAGIKVEVGLLVEAAEQLNPGFVKRMRSGKPYLTAKMGMSMDGRTAMASGESQWISCPESRRQVQMLRARSSAVITGSGTILADNPAMNVRAEELDTEFQQHSLLQPLRLILDSGKRISSKAKIFHTEGPVAWVSVLDTEVSESEHLTHVNLPATSEGKVDLAALMDYLGQRGCNEVLLEAGPVLTGAFVAADLVDEMVLYMAPKLLGDQARGLVRIPGLDKLSDARVFSFSEAAAIGTDVRLTFKRV